MIRKKLYFDDVFADLMLIHMLNHARSCSTGWTKCSANAELRPS
jgi:hypothetical protein